MPEPTTAAEQLHLIRKGLNGVKQHPDRRVSELADRILADLAVLEKLTPDLIHDTEYRIVWGGGEAETTGPRPLAYCLDRAAPSWGDRIEQRTVTQSTRVVTEWTERVDG